MKIKLAIGLPNSGTIKTQTVFSLCRALKSFPHDYKLIFKEGSILHANREIIIKRALEEKCTHLLFLDSDMVFDEDAIVRLLARKKDIVGVNYNTRQYPTLSTAIFKPSTRKFIKAESVATGFMLIDLKVFKDLPHPWFFWESDDQGEVLTGEDYWFCRLAREKGYEVWVDLTIKVGHLGDTIY